MGTTGTLTLRALTPEGIIFEEDNLNTINIPLADGPIGIRPGHAPLIAETDQGVVRYRSADKNDEIYLYAGILNIRDNVITLVTAGQVEKSPDSMAEPSASEYDRLMQTLIAQIQIEDETEQS